MGNKITLNIFGLYRCIAKKVINLILETWNLIKYQEWNLQLYYGAWVNIKIFLHLHPEKQSKLSLFPESYFG